MNIFNKKENASYTSEPPQTPYQLAQREWDARIGDARVQASNWRLVAILSLVAAVLLLLLLTITMATRTERIFVAEVTKTGQVVNVLRMSIGYNPTVAQKEYFLGEFINLTRGIPLDPVVARQNWLKAYKFLSRRGATQLNTYLRQKNPLDLLGKKTVTIKINDINPVSNSTFQIDWTEITTNIDGHDEGEKMYSGVFTLTTNQPTSQAEILQNPLGIYIVDFHISTREV